MSESRERLLEPLEPGLGAGRGRSPREASSKSISLSTNANQADAKLMIIPEHIPQTTRSVPPEVCITR